MTPARFQWRLSFYTQAIAFRFLLTPLGTIRRFYDVGDVRLLYCDIYIFGIRIARIHHT